MALRVVNLGIEHLLTFYVLSMLTNIDTFEFIVNFIWDIGLKFNLEIYLAVL